MIRARYRTSRFVTMAAMIGRRHARAPFPTTVGNPRMQAKGSGLNAWLTSRRTSSAFCRPSPDEKGFDLPVPGAAHSYQLTEISVREFAAQGSFVVGPAQLWVFTSITLEPVGLQSRHAVRHHLVVPEEHERAATSLATEPLDLRPPPSDVARCLNDSGAVLPLDVAAPSVRIKVRPNALAQILDCEGVVALAVKYRDEGSLDSAETPV